MPSTPRYYLMALITAVTATRFSPGNGTGTLPEPPGKQPALVSRRRVRAVRDPRDIEAHESVA